MEGCFVYVSWKPKNAFLETKIPTTKFKKKQKNFTPVIAITHELFPIREIDMRKDKKINMQRIPTGLITGIVFMSQ